MRYERPTADGVRSDVQSKENLRAVTWGRDRADYAAPAIDRREPIQGLLVVTKSEKQTPSDRAIKANVVRVAWGSSTRAAYRKPGIARREPLAGLLTVSKSEKKQPDTGTASDRAIKANVVPVSWDDSTPVTYEAPAIDGRQAVAGLLDSVSSENQQDVSDRNRKDNVVPVRW